MPKFIILTTKLKDSDFKKNQSTVFVSETRVEKELIKENPENKPNREFVIYAMIRKSELFVTSPKKLFLVWELISIEPQILELLKNYYKPDYIKVYE